MKSKFVLLIVNLILILSITNHLQIEDIQSKTGLRPPSEIFIHDLLKSRTIFRNEVILDVPNYLWRHGCGPTALGMVIGYYDNQGYDLIPGSAYTQTEDVDQSIASVGNFQDYGNPEDYYPYMLIDNYINEGRPAHINNSIADYMNTSRSSKNNYYGWSWSKDIGKAFISYVNPIYKPSYQEYRYITWDTFTNEIDNNHPMIFLVDVDGDGSSDHFITVIGYRDNQYASYDTWYKTIRWENFTYMTPGVMWGIWAGWTLHLDSYPNRIFLPLLLHLEGEQIIYP